MAWSKWLSPLGGPEGSSTRSKQRSCARPPGPGLSTEQVLSDSGKSVPPDDTVTVCSEPPGSRSSYVTTSEVPILILWKTLGFRGMKQQGYGLLMVLTREPDLFPLLSPLQAQSSSFKTLIKTYPQPRRPNIRRQPDQTCTARELVRCWPRPDKPAQDLSRSPGPALRHSAEL